MNNLNSVLVEGNLVRDPDFYNLTADAVVCKFSIATNRYYMDRNREYVQDTSFFQIQVWGRTAEACKKHLSKGRGVRIVGRLKQERWTDNDTKLPKERVVVVAEHIEFQPERKDENKPKDKDETPHTPVDVAKEPVELEEAQDMVDSNRDAIESLQETEETTN